MSEIVEQQIIDLQNAILESRDHAIGMAAELGEMRFQLAKARQENDSLVHQLDLIRSSRTWKIGRTMLLPLRFLRKVLRVLTR
jgi:hypothetical protein